MWVMCQGDKFVLRSIWTTPKTLGEPGRDDHPAGGRTAPEPETEGKPVLAGQVF